MQLEILFLRILKAVIAHFPAVVPHLRGRARWVAITSNQRNRYSTLLGRPYFDIEYTPALGKLGDLMLVSPGIDFSKDRIIFTDYKTYDYFLHELERMINNVYGGDLGGEFIDIMDNLLYGQFTQAYEQAWKDEEGEGDLPDYLISARDEMHTEQYSFVDQFYRDIIDAQVDETGVEALLARAPLWAQRWTEAYNEAVRLITLENGGNLIWQLGETEQHCISCSALNGIVARAGEWDELGVHPQGAPNDLIACGGWLCDCSLMPTDMRRSPKAYGSIINIVQKG